MSEKIAISILQEFVEILSGTLDNIDQVIEEKASGNQVHPYAKHVTSDCTHIVRNFPEDDRGRYILEESYYTYPGEEMIIKPLLFYVTEKEGTVYLNSVTVPERLDPAKVINANKELFFEHDELHIKPTFGAAPYKFNPEKRHFTTDHKCEFMPGLHFRLTETLEHGKLSVMETWIKDGVVTTPYNTPIIYIKQ